MKQSCQFWPSTCKNVIYPTRFTGSEVTFRRWHIRQLNQGMMRNESTDQPQQANFQITDHHSLTVSPVLCWDPDTNDHMQKSPQRVALADRSRTRGTTTPQKLLRNTLRNRTKSSTSVNPTGISHEKLRPMECCRHEELHFVWTQFISASDSSSSSFSNLFSLVFDSFPLAEEVCLLTVDDAGSWDVVD